MNKLLRAVIATIGGLCIANGAASAAEQVDIVFVLDFSGSTSGSELQMEDAVVEFLDGPNSIIPRDSSVAISVVRMLAGPHYTIFPLTTIDSESTMDSLVQQIRTFDHSNEIRDPFVSCTTTSGGCTGDTNLYPTLCRVGQIFDTADPASQSHHLILFTDFHVAAGNQVNESAELLRTRSTPVKISVAIANTFDGPCESTSACSDYIRAHTIANSPISPTYNPTQIEGGVLCFAPDVIFEPFGVMSLCESIDPFDSGTNGIPDLCERDDNENGIPDDVDISNDPSLDCNTDGVLDAVQLSIPLQFLQQPIGTPAEQIGDRYGESIATDGVSLAVGSPNDPTIESDFFPGFWEDTGAVYVYQQSDADSPWIQRGDRVVPPVLIGHNPVESLFGFSVAIEGDRLIVGAPDYNTQNGDTGGVFIYEFDTGLEDWVFQDVLTPADAFADDFGHSIALDGDRILIGDPFDDPVGLPSNYGSVSYYNRNTLTDVWSLTKELTLQDAFDTDPHDDRFGTAVAFVGDAIVGSAPRKNYNVGGSNRSNAGLVYSFYENTGGAFIPGNPLSGREFASSIDPDEFGHSLSGDGNFLAIGCPDYDNGTLTNSGRVFVYELDTAQLFSPTWINDTFIFSHDNETNDKFGHAVAIENDSFAGTTLAVSALRDSNPTGFDNGSAYLYRRNSSNDWQLLDKMFPQEDSDGWTYFGVSIAYSLGDVFIGTVDDESQASIFDGDLQRVDYFGPVPSCGGCSDADLSVPHGTLNFFDVSAFLSAFAKEDSRADMNSDGTFNFFDVSIFLTVFGQGCP